MSGLRSLRMKAAKRDKPRCSAFRRDGERCTRFVGENGIKCTQHAEIEAREKAEALKAGKRQATGKAKEVVKEAIIYITGVNALIDIAEAVIKHEPFFSSLFELASRADLLSYVDVLCHRSTIGLELRDVGLLVHVIQRAEAPELRQAASLVLEGLPDGAGWESVSDDDLRQRLRELA